MLFYDSLYFEKPDFSLFSAGEGAVVLVLVEPSDKASLVCLDLLVFLAGALSQYPKGTVPSASNSS